MIAKSFIQNDSVLDQHGKEWLCDVKLSDNNLVIKPDGYNKEYPFILSRDKVFLNNINGKLKSMGVKVKLSGTIEEVNEEVIIKNCRVLNKVINK